MTVVQFREPLTPMKCVECGWLHMWDEATVREFNRLRCAECGGALEEQDKVSRDTTDEGEFDGA